MESNSHLKKSMKLSQNNMQLPNKYAVIGVGSHSNSPASQTFYKDNSKNKVIGTKQGWSALKKKNNIYVKNPYQKV